MEYNIDQKDFDKLVNDKGNIPVLILVIKKEGDELIPVIVDNQNAINYGDGIIRYITQKALRDWINKLEPVG